MIRTQVQLKAWQYRGLKKMADVTQVSMASLIRRGVSTVLAEDKSDKPSREELRQRGLDFIKYIDEHPSEFQDIERKTDVSVNHDEYFAQAVAL